MKRNVTLWLAVCIFALLPLSTIQAQDTGVPDTVYYGDNGTMYGLPRGVFKIPVFLTTDQTIHGLTLGLEYFTSGVMPAYDSLTTQFSDPEVNVAFDLIHVRGEAHLDGVSPDTVGIVGIAISKFLSPGRYRLCDVYFHGLSVGEELSVDSSFFPIASVFTLVDGQSYYVPQFVGGTLQIVDAPLEIFLLSQTQYTGDAGYPLGMIIELASGSGVSSVTLDSIVNAATGVHVASDSLPPVLGLNPSQTTWTPNTIQYGIWHAYFTILDGQSHPLDVTLRLDVFQLPANCDVVRGDFNCDAVISIGDAVGVINYIFGGGPGPGCD